MSPDPNEVARLQLLDPGQPIQGIYQDLLGARSLDFDVSAMSRSELLDAISYMARSGEGAYRALKVTQRAGPPPRQGEWNEWAGAFKEPCHPCALRDSATDLYDEACWNGIHADIPLRDFYSPEAVIAFFHNRILRTQRTLAGRMADRESFTQQRFSQVMQGPQVRPQVNRNILASAPDPPTRASMAAEATNPAPGTVAPRLLTNPTSQTESSRPRDANAEIEFRTSRHQAEEAARSEGSRVRRTRAPGQTVEEELARVARQNANDRSRLSSSPSAPPSQGSDRSAPGSMARISLSGAPAGYSSPVMQQQPSVYSAPGFNPSLPQSMGSFHGGAAPYATQAFQEPETYGEPAAEPGRKRNRNDTGNNPAPRKRQPPQP